MRGHKAILAAKQNAKGQVGKSRWERFKLEQEFPTIDELTSQASDFDTEAPLDIDAFAKSLGLKKKGQ